MNRVSLPSLSFDKMKFPDFLADDDFYFLLSFDTHVDLFHDYGYSIMDDVSWIIFVLGI